MTATTSTIPTISTTSIEYVGVPVTSPVDITLFTVMMAIVPTRTQPTVDNYHSADWREGTTPPVAEVLVGAGTAFVLTAGTWDVWVKIASLPETIVRRSGSIRVV